MDGGVNNSLCSCLLAGEGNYCSFCGGLRRYYITSPTNTNIEVPVPPKPLNRHQKRANKAKARKR